MGGDATLDEAALEAPGVAAGVAEGLVADVWLGGGVLAGRRHLLVDDGRVVRTGFEQSLLAPALRPHWPADWFKETGDRLLEQAAGQADPAVLWAQIAAVHSLRGTRFRSGPMRLSRCRGWRSCWPRSGSTGAGGLPRGGLRICGRLGCCPHPTPPRGSSSSTHRGAGI